MKKIILFFFASMTIMSQAQTFDWGFGFGSPIDDRGNSVTTDSDGNIYLVGTFYETLDFDRGVGVTNLTSNGANDIFVQKLNSAGDLIWAKSMGQLYSDDATSVAVDSSGNVITVGIFQLTADFDPNAGVLNLTSNGDYDPFIQKLNSNGDIVWAKSFGGTQVEVAIGLDLDAAGNVYVTGDFVGTMDFNPGGTSQNITAAGLSDSYVLKLANNGDFVWVKTNGSASGSVQANAITVDAVGNSIAAGRFVGTVDFDPSASVTALTSAGSVDVAIQKLNTNGDLIWAKSFGGTNAEYPNSLDISNDGSIFIAGRFYDTTDFDPSAAEYIVTSNGAYDGFVLKLNSDGDFSWVSKIGGTEFYDDPRSIHANSAGNVFITGDMSGSCDLDLSSGTQNYTTVGGVDFFLIKLDESTASIKENKINLIQVYPNPATDYITIQSDSNIESVSIYTINGQLLQTEKEANFSIAQLSAGVYFIHAQTANGVVTRQFIKK